MTEPDPRTTERDGARVPLWIRTAGLILPARYRAEIVADLVEERDAMVDAGTPGVFASAWLVAHLARSAVASRRAGWTRDRVAGLASAAARHTVRPAGEWRQALRSLRRSPWYAMTVIAVMALSMALASTVFAVVDGVLFEPLPYPNPDELYVVSGRHDDDGGPPERGVGMVSPDEVAAWSAAVPDVPIANVGYSSVAFSNGTMALAIAADGDFFDVFGIRLLTGGVKREEFVAGQPVMPIVISQRLWREEFAADDDVLGRMVQPFAPPDLGRPSYQIVGVMEADGFVPPLPGGSASAARRSSRIDAVMPAFTEALMERSGLASRAFPPVAWLRPAPLRAAVAAFREAAPPRRAGAPASMAPYDYVDLLPLRDFVSSRERPVFALAFGMAMSLVVLVLLNVGALAAARSQQRIRDLSLRRALGARTRDLLRRMR
ncbi:MAG: ABC transporter permease [Vicinamibacterales bacterium]